MPTRRNTGDSPITAHVPHYQCRFCGTSFPVAHHGKRGRPPEHCSKECREASAAMSVLDKWLGPVAKRADVEHWQQIRFQLWSLANSSSKYQKAMAQKSKEKQAAIRATPEAAARQKRLAKPAYIVTIGNVPVSDDLFTSEAAAKKAARDFSISHLNILVDVRTAISKDKRAHYRSGKSVPLYHANPRG